MIDCILAVIILVITGWAIAKTMMQRLFYLPPA